MENTKDSIHLHYQVKWLARLFAKHADYQEILLAADRLILNKPHQQLVINLMHLDEGISLHNSFFWSTISIPLDDGRKIQLGGLNNRSAPLLWSRIKNACNSYQQQYIKELKPSLLQACLSAKKLLSSTRYIRQQQIDIWFKTHDHITTACTSKVITSKLRAAYPHYFKSIQDLLIDGKQFFRHRNESFVDNELSNYKEFFDYVESKPLTYNQRKSCVINEQNNLVIAGAGTGKTSTMVGRAGYLLLTNQASPQQVLMLAFGSDAAKEMSERIQIRLKTTELTVKTFHSLGKQIITSVEGKVPSINKMAEDSFLKISFVDEQFKQLIKTSNKYKAQFINCISRYSYPYQTIFHFGSLGEYLQYIKEHEVRTLNGELVKSLEECEIANYLCRQGIKYEYETNYTIDTSGPDHKRYQPDFFLTEYDIYIEHFAVDANGNTPRFIDQTKYLQGMQWKRDLHQKHNTQLIETYSYQKRNGNLLSELAASLTTKNVEFKPISDNKLLEMLNEKGMVSAFSRLLTDLLSLLKSTLHTIQQLVDNNKSAGLVAVIELFKPIYQAYEDELTKTDTIDFDDMISKAVSYVETKKYKSPFTHILVDEFQDISASRARLIKALVNQHEHGTLFCVGDDWQSIYRFTGSDISITKNFSHHFGHTATSVLDQTFRFNNKIAEVSSRYISQNPEQLNKHISSLKQVTHSAISLIKTSNNQSGLAMALKLISDQVTTKASVLVLVRFKHDRPKLTDFKASYSQLTINVMTAHAAKGKEADYVIILGLIKGKFGFPSEKATHPLLQILLPPQEKFKHAEERRLFYVALTRAKQHVYLITDANKPSDFIRELINDKYDISIPSLPGLDSQTKLADVPCPKCKSGFLLTRNGANTNFNGCSNYPLCNHTQPVCEWCGNTMKIKGRLRICGASGCKFKQPICPKCQGSMKLRQGQYGKFWGCNHYKSDAEFSCSHQEKFIDLNPS